MSYPLPHESEHPSTDPSAQPATTTPSAGPAPETPVARQVQELIGRAAAGDPEAAAQLLAVLDGADVDAQALVAAELDRTTAPVLWQRLVRFLASGRWADLPLHALPSLDRPQGRRLRRRLRAAFVPHPQAGAEPAKREALLASLRTPQPEVQVVAIDLLALRGERGATDDLIRSLSSPALLVRERAAAALGRLGGHAAVEALIRTLYEAHDVLGRHATQALIQIGADAVPPLIDALRSPDPDVRWHAAEALAEICDLRSVDALVGALGDAETGVRWHAARGLARMGKPAIVAVLRALETQPLTPWLAHAAGLVLHHAALPEYHRTLRPVAEALNHPAASVEVPVRAAEALAELT